MLDQGFTHVLLMDGDMQHLPGEAAPLLAEAERSGADIVVGERRFERDRMPASRYYANRIGSRVLSWFVGIPVRDTQCGFRVFRVDALRRAAADGDRLRNRNGDAGEGRPARRTHRVGSDLRRLRRPKEQAAAGARHHADLFSGRVLIASSNVSERSVTDSPPTWIR